MNDKVEQFRQRRDARLKAKADGGPGSGKKPKGGSQSSSGSSNSTKTATKTEHFNLLKSFSDRTDFMNKVQEVYDTMPEKCGFEFKYADGRKEFFTKQTDGSLIQYIPRTGKYPVSAKNAVRALRDASAGAAITNVTESDYGYTMGATIIGRSGRGLNFKE